MGDASGKNVGTGAGTVAAGDDSRIVAAFTDTLNATAANTASTLVKRDASGNIAATNVLSSNNSTNNLYLYDGVNSVRLKAPAGLAANYVLTLPADDGTAGQLLQTDGSGNLTWATGGGGGTVANVTASAPLASSGGTNPNLTITQASNSSAGFISSGDWTTFNSKQNNLGFTPLDAAYFNAGDFAIVSSSPELFLRMSGSHVVTRPIKGTRPRSPDPIRDAQLSYELQTSAKEMAELVTGKISQSFFDNIKTVKIKL